MSLLFVLIRGRKEKATWVCKQVKQVQADSRRSHQFILPPTLLCTSRISWRL